MREEAQDWVDLNTPLTKAYCTDSAFELGSLAIQVYGGHGFITEHGVEQIARDSKILCLYEGTNGIQSMDLVRRKLMMHGGRLPARFFARVREALDAPETPELYKSSLGKAIDALESATKDLLDSYKSSPDQAGFGAVDYLKAFSLCYVGFNWLRMVRAAEKHPDANFRQTKQATGDFFIHRMLPQVHSLLANLRAPVEQQVALTADHFLSD